MTRMLKICAWEGCDNIATDKEYCGYHGRLIRKSMEMDKRNKEKRELLKKHAPKQRRAAINKINPKQAEQLAIYNRERGPWLKGKKCAVYPKEDATEVHHRMGKRGYADQWAKDNGITLLNDKRFWLPTSKDGHAFIENNPDIAKENGWSINKLTRL